MSEFDKRPVRLSDRRFLEGGELSLSSDAVKSVDVYGRFFLVRSANQEFQMRFHGGNWFAIDQGEGFDLGDDDRFSKLYFRRVPGTSGTVNLKWRTADCNMFDARLSIVRDPLHLGSLDVQRAKSFALQFTPDAGSLAEQTIEIPAGAAVPIPGLFNVEGLTSPFQITPSAETDFRLQWTVPATTGLVVRQSLRIQCNTTNATDVPLRLVMERAFDSGEVADTLFDTEANIALMMPVAHIYPAPTASAGVVIPNNSNVFYTEDSQTYILHNPTAVDVDVMILAVYDKPLEMLWPGP